MNCKKPQIPRYLIALTLISLLVPSCRVFESIDNLRQEAEEILVNFPKTNYKSVFIDFSHRRTPRPSSYLVLRNMLEDHDFTFIETPDADPNLSDDSPLLAALRQDIGVLIIPEPDRVFSDKELRALELFVVFGGRLITTAPEAASITPAFTSLLAKFGMSAPSGRIGISEPMYFPENGSAEAQGHIMTISEEIRQAGFHDFDQVVMLSPEQLTFNENHRVFNHTVIASKNDGSTKNTVIKATSKLTTQKGQGHLIVMGDGFMNKAPVQGGSQDPQKVAYQGGMITSGNFKFLVNTLTIPGDTIVIDDRGPTLDLQIPSSIQEGVGFIRPTGNIIDLGGVVKITFRLNESLEVTSLDALNNPGERKKVDRSLSASQLIRIPESLFRPGTNTLEVTATDQFLNESSQTLVFDFALRTINRSITLSSKLPNSEEINPEMGVEATGPGVSYPNRATFGGFLSESIWNGPENSTCEESSESSLLAVTRIRSAPQGAGRVESMQMPATQQAIDSFRSFASLLTFHFQDLSLAAGVRIINHSEERIYANTDGSLFIIQFAGTPIISAPMNPLTMVLLHNSPGNCNDDVINVTSGFLPVSTLSVLPNLPAREAAIARAFLADLRGATGLRYNVRVFDRIIHGQNSYLRTPQGDLRYPIGVPHPDSATPGLDGFAIIEIR
ncbi:MAG: hypothetical protein HEP71_12565 [Roseivirga sp.]|nr:hypothetical protein [Roseivirga sp.]